MTTVLAIIAAAIIFAAFAQTVRHYADKVIDEILAAELRQIERDRAAGVQAGFDAGWHGGGRR